MLNQKSRPEIVEQDNAWPHYERAIALAVEPSPELQAMSAFKHRSYAEHRDFAALPKKTLSAIKDWPEAIQPAWQQIVIGAARPLKRSHRGSDRCGTSADLAALAAPQRYDDRLPKSGFLPCSSTADYSESSAAGG